MLLSKISFFVNNVIQVDRYFLLRDQQIRQVIFKPFSRFDRIWTFWSQCNISIQDYELQLTPNYNYFLELDSGILQKKKPVPF